MGSIVEAQCPCGFTSEAFFLGSGMDGASTRCAMPALCPRCRRIGAHNIGSKRPRCGVCRGPVRGYAIEGNPARDPDAAAPVFDWNADGRTFVLPDAGYRCPECDQLTMRFFACGCWD